MSYKYRPHLCVLPEDDANRQIANGFMLHPKLDPRAFRILPEAGGWLKVLGNFNKDHVAEMTNNLGMRMVFLIDFDGKIDRFEYAKSKIPQTFHDRVFILGTISEPERLKAEVQKSFEAIGQLLAAECAEDNLMLWNHVLLVHNQNEISRIKLSVKSFLFPSV